MAKCGCHSGTMGTGMATTTVTGMDMDMVTGVFPDLHYIGLILVDASYLCWYLCTLLLDSLL